MIKSSFQCGCQGETDNTNIINGDTWEGRQEGKRERCAYLGEEHSRKMKKQCKGPEVEAYLAWKPVTLRWRVNDKTEGDEV